MSEINADAIRHVATLSRLEFDDAEIDARAAELRRIMDHFERLNELDTADVPPTSHAISTENVFRDDEPRESLPNEAALRNAPDRDGPYFKVPPILPGE